jgi:hypothetical protein
MSLESKIDLEGTSLGVLATEKEDISDLSLLFTVVSVEHLTGVMNLSQQLNGGLGIIGIRSLHVQIIDEVDENLGTKTSLDFFGLVDKFQLEVDLHIGGSGVRVEVDVGERNLIGISSVQEILDDDSLTGTGVTDEKHGLSPRDGVVTEFLKSASLDGVHQDLGEEEVIIFRMLIWDDHIVPFLPIIDLRVEVVIEDGGSLIIRETGLALVGFEVG